jgi:hypothetical protein
MSYTIVILSTWSFTMGHRKLYHTSEEKAIANRMKSKKYYERYCIQIYSSKLFFYQNFTWRCKSGINRKRCSKYTPKERKQIYSADTVR